MIGDYITDTIETLISELKKYNTKILFVGDGSVLCVDKNYNFCCAYHGMDIEEASLTFLIEEELEALKERIEEEE